MLEKRLVRRCDRLFGVLSRKQHSLKDIIIVIPLARLIVIRKLQFSIFFSQQFVRLCWGKRSYQRHSLSNVKIIIRGALTILKFLISFFIFFFEWSTHYAHCFLRCLLRQRSETDAIWPTVESRASPLCKKSLSRFTWNIAAKFQHMRKLNSLSKWRIVTFFSSIVHLTFNLS